MEMGFVMSVFAADTRQLGRAGQRAALAGAQGTVAESHASRTRISESCKEVFVLARLTNRVQDQQKLPGRRDAPEQTDLPQDLEFSRRYLVTFEKSAVADELSPRIVGTLGLGGLVGQVYQVLRVGMRQEEEFLSIEPKDIDDSSEERYRGSAETTLEVSDVAGLDAQLKRELTLRQSKGLALSPQHLSERFFGHMSYRANKAGRDLRS